MSTTSELAALNAVGKGGADIRMPNRGTATGMNGDTYGFDCSGDSTNTMTGMVNTKSDMPMETCPGGDC